MLSKNQVKLITRLKQKKYRLQDQLFVAEGVKTIQELLESRIELHHLYTITKEFDVSDVYQTLISENDLKKISFLKTPNTALAVFKIPKPKPINSNTLIVALDDVRDPGNLGTIIRLCDWFGIENLVGSLDTADCYNPKVIQATMGSISRVNITYLDLKDFLSISKTPVFGAYMDGKVVYDVNLPDIGVLILGNEANGISRGVESFINHKITIPRFGKLQATESLNVASATAILLSEFRRQ